MTHGPEIWWLEAGIEEMYRYGPGHAACKRTSTRHAPSPPSQMRCHVHDLAANRGNLLPIAESLPCEIFSIFLCKPRINSLSEQQSIFLVRKRQLMQMLFFTRRQPSSTTKEREPRSGECKPCFVSGRSTEGQSCIHGESPKAPSLAPQSKPQHNTRRF